MNQRGDAANQQGGKDKRDRDQRGGVQAFQVARRVGTAAHAEERPQHRPDYTQQAHAEPYALPHSAAQVDWFRL
jgi:hypothetical protein